MIVVHESYRRAVELGTEARMPSAASAGYLQDVDSIHKSTRCLEGGSTFFLRDAYVELLWCTILDSLTSTPVYAARLLVPLY